VAYIQQVNNSNLVLKVKNYTQNMWDQIGNNCLVEQILLILPLALQPTVGFGLSNNTLPFFPIYHQLSPSAHSQHLKISFYFLFPSFP